MDPNATLRELRNLIESDGDPEFTFDRVADLFFALDGWISSGGFLPSSWTVKRSQGPLPVCTCDDCETGKPPQ